MAGVNNEDIQAYEMMNLSSGETDDHRYGTVQEENAELSYDYVGSDVYASARATHSLPIANVLGSVGDHTYETVNENTDMPGIDVDSDEYTSSRAHALQANNGSANTCLKKHSKVILIVSITLALVAVASLVVVLTRKTQGIKECHSSPCLNNATCVDGLNSYSCRCLPGYNGTYCEIDINECANYPCLNNATCVDSLNSYSCRCLPGYSGTNCEIDIDDCANASCQNGATCNDRVNGYFCRCTDNWVGTHCDQRSHYGTEFYIGLYPVYRDYHDIVIDIASQQDGTAVLSVPFLNVNRSVTVTTGATTLKVDKSIMAEGTFIENRGIRIQTDVPVALFVTMYTNQTYAYMDTYLALPVTALGTSYKVASYHSPLDPAFYSVFGMRENTNVTTHIKKQSASFTSEPFSVGQHDNSRDFTDTYIQSDNIIAVISGSVCAPIPLELDACNYIVEQMVPTRHWVKHFIVPPVFPKQGFVLKILTIHNETVCIKNTTNTICNYSSNLPDGGMLMGTDPVVVTSAAPISAVQYGVGYFYDDVDGGEFMTVIPGISSYLNDYYFVVPSVYINIRNYLSVIVPSSQAQELYLDGSSLTVIKQYNVPDPFSNYTVIIANITVGYHRLWHKDSNVMFGATVYGLRKYYGYGYGYGYGVPVGFSFTNG